MCGMDSCGSPKVVILNVRDHRDQIVVHFDVPPRESRTEIFTQLIQFFQR
jgi:hypothetical protein